MSASEHTCRAMLAVLSVLACAATGWAGNPLAKGSEAAPVKVTRPPVLDGKLDDPCWREAVLLPRFTHRGRPANSETYAYVCYDDQHLYVGVHCGEPLVAQMRRKHTHATPLSGPTTASSSSSTATSTESPMPT